MYFGIEVNFVNLIKHVMRNVSHWLTVENKNYVNINHFG